MRVLSALPRLTSESILFFPSSGFRHEASGSAPKLNLLIPGDEGEFGALLGLC